MKKSKVNVVEDTLPPVPQNTPVPEAVRQKIQQLIQEKQYSAAEAQVNQALKKTILSMLFIYYYLKFILHKKMSLL